ncbi:hypothetical protein MHU86_135 [Fragilaria crotonensis]|nr:hypothetical protein MHU86_135 [Fragilaria crotonensis]
MCQRFEELLTLYGEPDAHEAETGLLETLSALGSLDESESSMSQSPLPLLEQVWSDFFADSHSTGTCAKLAIPIEGDENANLWRAGSSLIATLLRKLSPFEVHTSSSQALMFSDDANSRFSAFCLILCAWSLKQCPAPPELKKWKRWQSMLCETVRLFQTFRNPDWEVSIWVEYLLPTLESLKSKLPEDALHVGIDAALIGTTLELIAKHPHETAYCRPAMERIMESREILSHPWKALAFRPPDTEGADNQCAMLHKTNLVWWTECADEHDSICAIDTTWSTTGMACLAWECWRNESAGPQSSPLSLDIWNIYFPHVQSLLLEDDQCRVGLNMLHTLLSVLPRRTIVEWQNAPANPIGTLQLVSNQLIRASQQRDQQATTATVTLIQSLVDKYVPTSQVELVSQLTQDCPYPGLQPKFLDLLRPLACEDFCPQLWDFLRKLYFQEMLKHVGDGGLLLGVETLLDEVEVYVSATSMVQLHLMVRGNWPEGLQESAFDAILAAGRATLNDWESEENRPRGFHRLFLLQSALERIHDLRTSKSK